MIGQAVSAVVGVVLVAYGLDLVRLAVAGVRVRRWVRAAFEDAGARAAAEAAWWYAYGAQRLTDEAAREFAVWHACGSGRGGVDPRMVALRFQVWAAHQGRR